jgi:predicted transcriptional regulator
MLGRLELYPASNLADMDFPPVRFVVDKVLPEGLSLLVGPPKAGKSWMALDMALAVAGGEVVLGDKNCWQGGVLYLALEDSPRRIKSRIEQLRGGDYAIPESLLLSHKPVKLDEGLCRALVEWVGLSRDPRLVIIDTLQKVRSVKRSVSDLYAEDVETLSQLQEVTKKYAVSILCLHHRRKAPAEDRIDTVSGTLGVPGTVDSILLLDRPRFKREGRLWVTGRDVEEAEYALDVERTFTWRIRGYARRFVGLTQERMEVYKLLEDYGVMSISQIAEMLRKSKESIRQLIRSMLSDGQIRRVDRGMYAPGIETLARTFSWDEVPEWAEDLVEDLP